MVAGCIALVAAVGEASCSPGRLLIQQVGMGGCPGRSGGGWDLNLPGTFYRLQTEKFVY